MTIGNTLPSLSRQVKSLYHFLWILSFIILHCMLYPEICCKIYGRLNKTWLQMARYWLAVESWLHLRGWRKNIREPGEEWVVWTGRSNNLASWFSFCTLAMVLALVNLKKNYIVDRNLRISDSEEITRKEVRQIPKDVIFLTPWELSKNSY